MPVYLVTRNEQLYRATDSEREAHAIFDGIVHSGQYRHAAVLSVSGCCRSLVAEAGREV